MYEYWKDILFFLDGYEAFMEYTSCIDTNDLTIQGSGGIPFSKEIVVQFEPCIYSDTSRASCANETDAKYFFEEINSLTYLILEYNQIDLNNQE